MHKKQDHALVFKTTFLYKIEKKCKKQQKQPGECFSGLRLFGSSLPLARQLKHVGRFSDDHNVILGAEYVVGARRGL